MANRSTGGAHSQSTSPEQQDGETEEQYLDRRKRQADAEARKRPPASPGAPGARVSGTGTVGARSATGAVESAGRPPVGDGVTPVASSTAPSRTAPESGVRGTRGSNS